MPGAPTRQRSDGQAEVGVQFDGGQEKAIARVAVAVFHTEVTAEEAPLIEERNLVWERATA